MFTSHSDPRVLHQSKQRPCAPATARPRSLLEQRAPDGLQSLLPLVAWCRFLVATAVGALPRLAPPRPSHLVGRRAHRCRRSAREPAAYTQGGARRHGSLAGRSRSPVASHLVLDQQLLRCELQRSGAQSAGGRVPRRARLRRAARRRILGLTPRRAARCLGVARDAARH